MISYCFFMHSTAQRWRGPGTPKRHFCKNKWIAKSILNYHVLLDTLIKHTCLKSTFSSEIMQAPKRYLWWENGKVPINMVNTLTLIAEKLCHYSAHCWQHICIQTYHLFVFFLLKSIQTFNMNHINRLNVAPELYLEYKNAIVNKNKYKYLHIKIYININNTPDALQNYSRQHLNSPEDGFAS